MRGLIAGATVLLLAGCSWLPWVGDDDAPPDPQTTTNGVFDDAAAPIRARPDPVSVADGATGDFAVHLGSTLDPEWADNTAEFLWMSETTLLARAEPIIQQRIDPRTGSPRFHIYGARFSRAKADEICDGLRANGHECTTVQARR